MLTPGETMNKVLRISLLPGNLVKLNLSFAANSIVPGPPPMSHIFGTPVQYVCSGE